jgi:general secretion pathway protein D
LIPRLRKRAADALLLGGGAVLVLSMAACSPESVAYRAARKAELRKDYDTAVIDYDKALQVEPENPKYLIGEKLARTKAGNFHMAQGAQLLAEGQTDQAIGEYDRAAKIDPSNETAKQELRRLLTQQAAAKEAREKALQKALTPPEAPAEPLGIQLKPLPTEAIAHFQLSADSRRVFEALGKLLDVNMVFNYDFQPGRTVSLDLNNVKPVDLLQAAAYEAHVFWKPISSNTILIIPDSPTNRREYQDDVLKTIHLSNPLAPQERTQISTALRQVLGLQRIIDNPAANAIIIRDTPEKVAAAEQVIKNLDLGKAEVLVDVTILEADRDRMTKLGLIPITNLSVIPNPNTAVSGTVNGQTQTAGVVGLAGPISSHDFAWVLPSATADALLSDSTTRVLQNPEVRVTDGQTAKLKVGSRIPYAVGSFLPSLAGTTTVGGTTGLLASTQFQYQDIGVNLEMTPHITQTGEIALHAKVEITSQAGQETIGGLSEPVFGQRSIEQDIQLQEGEVSVLGGLIQKETTNAVSGLPGLGDIPLVKYLFSETQKTTMDDEVLIMLNPHVVRLPEIAPNSETVVSSDTSGGLPIRPGVGPQP